MGLSACSGSRYLLRPAATADKSVPVEVLRTFYRDCSGSGVIYASGMLEGRLPFEYSCTGDTAYILLRDLLGRKILFVRLAADRCDGWNIIQNQRFSDLSLLSEQLGGDMFTPRELAQILWGTVPPRLKEINPRYGYRLNYQFRAFDDHEGPEGTFLTSLDIHSPQAGWTASIHFTERNWGNNNPAIVLNIPDTIPRISR